MGSSMSTENEEDGLASSAAADRSRLGTVDYWCHQCQATVPVVGEEIICPQCRGGFLEKVEISNPVDQQLGSIFGGGGRARASQPNQHPVMFSIGGDGASNRRGPSNRPSSVSNSSSSNSTMPAADFIQLMMNSFQDQQRASALQRGVDPPTARTNTQQPSSTPAAAASGGSSAPAPTPQFENPMVSFIQQIFNNATEGGTGGGNFQIQFQTMNDNNDTDGGGAFQLPSFQLHGDPRDYAWGPNSLDAIVTQLLNQIEGGAPPLSGDTINNLPVKTITQEQVDKRVQCAVCFEEYTLNESVKELNCQHVFHLDCIKPWLERHNTCPICRTEAAEVVDNSGNPNTVSGGSNQQAPSANNAAQGSSSTNNPNSLFSFSFGLNPTRTNNSNNTTASSQRPSEPPPEMDPLDEYD